MHIYYLQSVEDLWIV